MERNSYSYGIAISLFGCILFKGIAIPLRRGIYIPLKKEWTTYSFPVGINKIRLLPKSPNPLNIQVSYLPLSLCFSTRSWCVWIRNFENKI
jgi:hypothetical protein